MSNTLVAVTDSKQNTRSFISMSDECMDAFAEVKKLMGLTEPEVWDEDTLDAECQGYIFSFIYLDETTEIFL